MSGNLHKICASCNRYKYCHECACPRPTKAFDDEAIFQPPPPKEECPICFLPMPPSNLTSFLVCCGKIVCSGCINKTIELNEGKCDRRHQPASERLQTCTKCPFCNMPMYYWTPGIYKENDEYFRALHRRVDANDANAIATLGDIYKEGMMLPKDLRKSVELWDKAAKLGNIGAYNSLGLAYMFGYGVEKNNEKAKYHWEEAALGGDEVARMQLGIIENNIFKMFGKDYNARRAMKHFMISATGGYAPALDEIKAGYVAGIVSKDEYANTLRSYQKNQDEQKSELREKAIVTSFQKKERERAKAAQVLSFDSDVSSLFGMDILNDSNAPSWCKSSQGKCVFYIDDATALKCQSEEKHEYLHSSGCKPKVGQRVVVYANIPIGQCCLTGEVVETFRLPTDSDLRKTKRSICPSILFENPCLCSNLNCEMTKTGTRVDILQKYGALHGQEVKCTVELAKEDQSKTGFVSFFGLKKKYIIILRCNDNNVNMWELARIASLEREDDMNETFLAKCNVKS